MAIQAACPHCSKIYALAETQAGKKVRCKNCTEAFIVKAPLPPRSRDDDDEPRPRRKKKGGMPTGLLIGLGVGAFVLLLVCMGGGGVLLFMYGPFGNKVTKENYEKIQNGMTEAQVKDILGSPNAGNETQTLMGGSPRSNVLGMSALAWKHDNDAIVVMFVNGKVSGKMGTFTGKRK